jgi:hypothetical protein
MMTTTAKHLLKKKPRQNLIKYVQFLSEFEWNLQKHGET